MPRRHRTPTRPRIRRGTQVRARHQRGVGTVGGSDERHARDRQRGPSGIESRRAARPAATTFWTATPPRAFATPSNAIHSVSIAMIILAIAFAVVAVAWSRKRRPKHRIESGGEAAVELPLRRILPLAYWGMWSALVASLIVTSSASSLNHAGMTIQDVIDYRTRLAIGAVGRSLLWACWVLAVPRTRYQTRRGRLLATKPTPF